MASDSAARVPGAAGPYRCAPSASGRQPAPPAPTPSRVEPTVSLKISRFRSPSEILDPLWNESRVAIRRRGPPRRAWRRSQASARPRSHPPHAAGWRRDGRPPPVRPGREPGRHRQGSGEQAPAPGPAQVQAVKMRDLAVGAVPDRRGLEQRRGLPLCAARQEVREPSSERGRGQKLAHARGLHQRRGEEVVAARLPRLAIPVAHRTSVRLSRAAGQAAPSPGRARVIGRHREREGRVGMRAGPDRIMRARHEILEPPHDQPGQRCEGVGPAPVMVQA